MHNSPSKRRKSLANSINNFKLNKSKTRASISLATRVAVNNEIVKEQIFDSSKTSHWANLGKQLKETQKV